jgi:hypothetical protein
MGARARLVLALLVVASLGSCGSPAAPTMRTTRDAWLDLHLTCVGPSHDNVPSGLDEWRCAGMIDGQDVKAQIDEQGSRVDEFGFIVPASAGAETATHVFRDLIGATPAAASIAANVATWLDGWSGARKSLQLGSGFAELDSDAGAFYLTVRPPQGSGE